MTDQPMENEMYNEIAGRLMTETEQADHKAQYRAQDKLNLVRMAHDITRIEDPEQLMKIADQLDAWSRK
jgi:hypothetical protein